jgi:hypothetical protein
MLMAPPDPAHTTSPDGSVYVMTAVPSRSGFRGNSGPTATEIRAPVSKLRLIQRRRGGGKHE